MDILNTIRNARPGTMVDIRLDRDGVGCVDSFEIEKLWALLRMPMQVYGLTDMIVAHCDICDKEHARWIGCDGVKEDDYTKLEVSVAVGE